MIQNILVGFIFENSSLKICFSHFFYISLHYMKNQFNQVANCLHCLLYTELGGCPEVFNPPSSIIKSLVGQ